MNDPILEMRGVSKSFFGIKALRAVDLTVYAGEIHALMGENGAGKSTLMKILSGAYRPDPGVVGRRERAAVRADPPASCRGAGHHLHLASHGRGLRARRSRHRAARWPAGWVARQAGHPRRHHRSADGRARRLLVLQEGP